MRKVLLFFASFFALFLAVSSVPIACGAGSFQSQIFDRYYGASVFVPSINSSNQEVWLIGGRNSTGSLDDIFRVDPVTQNTQQVVWPLSIGPGFMPFATSNTTKVFVVGSASITASLDRLVTYDLQNSLSITVKNLSSPLTRLFGSSTIFHPSLGGKLVIFGGTSDAALDNNYLTHKVVLIFTNGTVAVENTSLNGPTSRLGHSAVYNQNQDRMYVFGGYFGGIGIDTTFLETYYLDMGTLNWVNITSNFSGNPTPRFGSSWHPFINNFFLLWGGADFSVVDNINSTYSDAWLFDSSLESWTQFTVTGACLANGFAGAFTGISVNNVTQEANFTLIGGTTQVFASFASDPGSSNDFSIRLDAGGLLSNLLNSATTGAATTDATTNTKAGLTTDGGSGTTDGGSGTTDAGSTTNSNTVGATVTTDVVSGTTDSVTTGSTTGSQSTTPVPNIDPPAPNGLYLVSNFTIILGSIPTPPAFFDIISALSAPDSNNSALFLGEIGGKFEAIFFFESKGKFPENATFTFYFRYNATSAWTFHVILNDELEQLLGDTTEVDKVTSQGEYSVFQGTTSVPLSKMIQNLQKPVFRVRVTSAGPGTKRQTGQDSAIVDNMNITLCPSCIPEQPQGVFTNDDGQKLGIGLGVGLVLGIGAIAGISAFFIVRHMKKTRKFLEDTELDTKAHMHLNDVQLLAPINSNSHVMKGVAFGKSTQVVLKKISKKIPEEKLEMELETLNQLTHPNIVRFYGFYQENDVMWVVTEYVERGSVLQRLQSDKISTEALYKMAWETAKGMAYLASKGIIHKNLNARNLLLDSHDNVKISDFAMELFNENSEGKIPENSKKVKYASPEVLREGKYSEKSDVWSFGITLYELWTRGSEPYPDIEPAEVFKKITEEKYRMLQPKSIHDEMWDFIRSCWEENPSKRPTFGSLAHDLEENIEEGSSSSSSSPNVSIGTKVVDGSFYANETTPKPQQQSTYMTPATTVYVTESKPPSSTTTYVNITQ